MTPAELFAAKLTGRQYGSEITEHEERAAAAQGLVVLFGYSDDNMEFRGAINDEIGCYDGGAAYLTSQGLHTRKCSDEDCPHEKIKRSECQRINAKWCSGEFSWEYETGIPHATFEIFEDEDKFCRGIVFALADVK